MKFFEKEPEVTLRSGLEVRSKDILEGIPEKYPEVFQKKNIKKKQNTNL